MREISEARLFRYRIPLQPAVALPGGPMRTREGIIVELTDSQGRCRFGEAAPLPRFSRERLDQVASELIQACRQATTGAREIGLRHPSSQFAWEMASTDCSPLPDTGNIGYPLLSGSPQAILARWRQWCGQRPDVIKLKLARAPVEAEVSLLEQLLDIAPVQLRIDANRLWSFAQAVQFAQHCSAGLIEQIDYVEEPTAQSEQFGSLYCQFGLRYAHDETTRQRHYRFRPQPGLAALILKPTLLGNTERLKSLIKPAHESNCKAVISSSFESSLAIRYLAGLAARLTPDEAPGLDTLAPLTADLLVQSSAQQEKPLWGLDQMEPLWPR